jgi:rRNA-processing protein FCF1|tara:strand:+ start:777 stop:1160 length:384 start_codon:yes stop_codon:yes gene_type:complete
MKKVILDTNFLLLPGLFKVDIFEEIRKVMNDKYELYIIEGTIAELNKIIDRKNKSRDKLNAKIGLELIKQKKVKKIKSSERNVDEGILDKADENTFVATSDKVLKQRLKKNNIKLIALRKKQYLVLE